jgi:hypothetical protein
VKPVRDVNNRALYREKWWIYAEPRPALTQALATIDKFLGLSAVSSFAIPVTLPTGSVMSTAIVVITDTSDATLAALTSCAHMLWVMRWGSLLGVSIRYSTTDVFDTFPQPEATNRLHSIGQVLGAERHEIMLRRDLGLTKLYNLVNDPELPSASDSDAARMREIQVELDEAVMAAYGWQDVPLNHGFHTYRQMERWTVCPEARVEILDRLLEENHRRATLQGDTVPAPADDEEFEE